MKHSPIAPLPEREGLGAGLGLAILTPRTNRNRIAVNYPPPTPPFQGGEIK